MSVDDSKPTEWSVSSNQDVGGFVRGLFRSLLRKAATSGVGGIPFPNLIAKSSDKLGDLLEFREQLKLDLNNNLYGNESMAEKFGRRILVAIPGFLKNSLLGTLLFTAYDNGMRVACLNSHTNCTTTHVVLIGGCCGFLHGFCSMSWDFLAASLRNRSLQQNLGFSKSGTLISHSLVHASLFSAYECFKLILPQYENKTFVPVKSFWLSSPAATNNANRQRDDDAILDSVLLKAVSIAISGAVAGITSEVTGHYLKPVEESGWRGIQAIFYVDRPSVRFLLSAALPSSVGFLAYEFGKDEFSKL